MEKQFHLSDLEHYGRDFLNLLNCECKQSFEVHSWPRLLVNYIFWLPLINWFGGDLFRLFISQTSPTGARVIGNATSHEALEEMYCYNFSSNNRHNFLDDIWQSLRNCKAMRNRLKLVKIVLRHLLILREGRANILSLGSGSARGVFEVLGILPDRYLNHGNHIVLVDIYKKALEYSRTLAGNLLGENYPGNIEFIRASARQVERFCDIEPDIVEMVGLLDYFSYENSIEILGLVHEKLADQGILVVGNVRENDELPFLNKTIRWRMQYKSPNEFQDILKKAGFEELLLLYEPLGIHGIAIARKS